MNLITRRDSVAWRAAHGERTNRPSTDPAHTVTGECWRWSWSDGSPLTPAQAGALQGFPVDYPWSGPKTHVAKQIGNAVPPPMAAALLLAVAR